MSTRQLSFCDAFLVPKIFNFFQPCKTIGGQLMAFVGFGIWLQILPDGFETTN